MIEKLQYHDLKLGILNLKPGDLIAWIDKESDEIISVYQILSPKIEIEIGRGGYPKYYVPAIELVKCYKGESEFNPKETKIYLRFENMWWETPLENEYRKLVKLS